MGFWHLAPAPPKTVLRLPLSLKKHSQWLAVLNTIPKGKALVATEDELGVKATSIKTIVTRFITNGEVPKTFTVSQRTINGKVTIYIINSAKETSE